MRRSLSQTEIIRKKQDIDRIFKQGKNISCMGMRLAFLENNCNFDRFIIIPAKHYGNAVERNKLRRRCKELFRLYPNRVMLDASENRKSHDIALVVYPGKVLSFSLLESKFYSLLDRIN